MMNETPIIRCRGVGVAYGRQRVLEDVTFDVPRGTLLPLVGPNGAGKTTLLRAMLGLVPLSEGRIETPFAAAVPGYVPQVKSIDPIYPVTCRRIVEMGLAPKLGVWRRSTRADRERTDSALRELDLLDHQCKPFSDLSGGMRQKTLLARAFVAGADVILLDEPTSELDEAMEASVLRILRRMVDEEGKTILFVHHGLHQAARLASSVCWVDHGRARIVASDEAIR